MTGRARDPREVRGAWTSFQSHSFSAPAPDLNRFVAYYWTASWDLLDQPPYHQLIVPSPSVHLVFREDSTLVHGVKRGHTHQVLAGIGRVFGVAFRPGSFRPFLGSPVSEITGRSVPAAEVFGPDIPERAMRLAADATAMIEVAECFLRAHQPVPDLTADEVADIVARIAAQPDLTRVDDLAAELGTTVRRLQRLFSQYVGVGPKWVIRRCRLNEVTTRMAGGAAIDWADLAADLGYADQAHLTRDFTAMVGESPTRYAARYPSPAG